MGEVDRSLVDVHAVQLVIDNDEVVERRRLSDTNNFVFLPATCLRAAMLGEEEAERCPPHSSGITPNRL
jgi:hypothetical protein